MLEKIPKRYWLQLYMELQLHEPELKRMLDAQDETPEQRIERIEKKKRYYQAIKRRLDKY